MLALLNKKRILSVNLDSLNGSVGSGRMDVFQLELALSSLSCNAMTMNEHAAEYNDVLSEH